MKTKFINIVKHFLLFFLVSLPLNLLAIDSSSRSTQESEYLNLKNLINNGSFNFAIFKRLAEIAPTPEAKLAYLRQADILSPRESTISSQIESTKEILNKNSPAKSFTSNKKILDIVSPKSYIPFYIQDFIIVGFSLTLVVLGFRQKRDIKTYLTLILLVFFLADKLFVSYTRSGDLKIIDSMSDITKSEGIVLNSIKTYARDRKSVV